MSVLVETSFGDIVIDLNTKKCPNACFNFLKLCKLKHYNNSLFMMVQKDYLAQVRTKNPTTIWHQMGQSSKYFNDQIDLEEKIQDLGIVATSNAGPNQNNSEFFMTLTKSKLSSLNGKHTVFGKVEEGFDVLKKINETYVDEKNRPKMNIRILHTFILDDPFEDKYDLKEPQSPQIQRESGRLEAAEHLEMIEKYKSENQILEATKNQKAKKQAVALELIGQLPDANVKPPENILFVCKLNPITQQRDLEIIFSRFGPIKSVEIVRDWKTGQSLQYGFIEFENEISCEQAYLKMENVVIDDRRIHVDFSQSVSKLMPKMRNNNQKSRKSGENRQKIKELIPKVKDNKNSFGEKKYEYVAKNTQKRQHYERYEEEPERQTKKKRARSPSYEQSERKSRSREKKQKKEKKKHKDKHKKHRRE